MVTEGADGPDDVMRSLLERLDISERLAKARMETFPLGDDVAVDVEPQARSRQSDALTPKGLSDLISSIGTVGQLQPIIVEERVDDGSLVLIAGERRLSAMAQGHAAAPDNPHFESIRALVVPGPLSEWERRAVQLAENLAREDLTQSDLGRALWYARCALFIERARSLGKEPPQPVFDEGNPVERWKLLNEWRADDSGLHNVGANWSDTVQTLGVELSEDRADEVAKAFRDIGEDGSEALDGLNASTRARKQIRAAKNEGLGDQVEQLIEAANELREHDSDANVSRLLEESAKRLRKFPDDDPTEVLNRVIADNEDREARKQASSDGDADAGSGGALPDGGFGDGFDDGFDDIGGFGGDGSDVAELGGDFDGQGSAGNGQPQGNYPPQSRLSDANTTRILKSSQVRRFIAVISESSSAVRDDVIKDLAAALEERADLADFDRNSLRLELEGLVEAANDALGVLSKFGIAAGTPDE